MATITTIEEARRHAIAVLEAAERARHAAVIAEYERTRHWSMLDWEMIDAYMDAGRALDTTLDIPRSEEDHADPHQEGR